MRFFLFLVISVIDCTAQTYTITRVTNPVTLHGRTAIGVTFNKSIPSDGRSIVTSIARWDVFKYVPGSTDPIPVEVTDARFEPDDTVELTVRLKPDETVTRWVVLLRWLNFPSGSTTPLDPGTGARVFSGAVLRKEADIYLSGALVAAEKAKPQYSIDSAIQVFKDLGHAGKLGLDATVIANQGPEVDPDSIRSTLTYRKIIPIPRASSGESTGISIVFDLSCVGGEFNRGSKDPKQLLEKPQVSNLLYASPQGKVLLPRLDVIRRGLMLEPEVLLGIELGSRLERLPHEADDSGITRVLFGSNVYLYAPSSESGRRLLITSQYRLRLPRSDEPYGFKGTGGEFQLVLDQRKRHYVSTDIEYLLTPGLALTAKYKWGSLPPLFPAITHQISVGLAVMIKQNGNH